MSLRGDQRALLQLLCERGQSYEDISGLLGVDTAEARSRAREALSELGGADPDAEVGLTDYLLGQADPIGRADAVRYLQSDPDALALATRIEDGLREVAPEANLPKLPEPRGRRARAAAPGPGEAEPAGAQPLASRPGSSRDSRQTRLVAALAALGVILLVAILAIAGVFGGGGSDPAETASSSTASTAPAANAASNITTVKLSPTGSSGVGGTAKFGLVNSQQLYVDLALSGLDPTPPKGAANLAWLMLGSAGGYPINNPVDSPITPDQNGNYSGRIAVPTAVALTVGNNAKSVRISSSPIRKVANAAKQAAKEQAPILPFIGSELASGDIPLATDASAAGAGAGAGGSGSGG